jgi:transcriptional regulator with XRE-family HTH domain
VRAARGRRSQAELAERAGVSRKSIILIEAGRTNPGYLAVERVAAACDAYLDQIAGRGPFGRGSPRFIYAERFPIRCLAKGPFAALAREWVASIVDNPTRQVLFAAGFQQTWDAATNGTLPADFQALIFSDVRSAIMRDSVVASLALGAAETPEPDEIAKLRIGRSVRKARDHENLTQTELAEKVEIDTNSLSNIEVGIHVPSYLTVERLADALSISIDELTGYEARPGARAVDLQIDGVGHVHAIYRRVQSDASNATTIATKKSATLAKRRAGRRKR